MPRPIAPSDRILRSHSRNMADNNQAADQEDLQEQNAAALNEVSENGTMYTGSCTTGPIK